MVTIIVGGRVYMCNLVLFFFRRQWVLGERVVAKPEEIERHIRIKE
jgi:hypothetical protein